MVDLELYKKRKKELNMTFEQLSEISGVPLQTLHNFFRGHTTHPRIDTMQAIERALGINGTVPAPSENEKVAHALTDNESRLLAAYRELVPAMQSYILEMTKKLVESQDTSSSVSKNASSHRA